jgi:uncharacterized membrane protein YebE (DUF533 family)
MALGRDAFVALAAVIWSDGKVTPDEAALLVGAARAAGLGAEDLAAVEDATRDPSDLPSLADLDLEVDERVVVYQVACRLAGGDGTVSTDERAMLGNLGDLLGLSAEERARAASGAVPADLSALVRAHCR